MRTILLVFATLAGCGDDSVGAQDASSSVTSTTTEATVGLESSSSSSASSSSTTGSGTTGAQETCAELQWEHDDWATEATQSLALALAVGDELVFLERRVESTATMYLHGLHLDGSVSFSPVLIGEVTDGDVALTPSGDVVVAASTGASSSLTWWSLQGAPLDEVELLSEGESLTGVAVVTHPDSLLVAGSVESVEQTVVQVRSPAGEFIQEHRGDHEVVLELAVAPDTGILALTSDPAVEGFSSFVEAYTADGEPLWSALAGSETGNFNENIAPFALTPDNEDGAIVLGSLANTRDSTRTANVLRFAQGEETWSVQTPVPEPPSPGGGGGGIARVGAYLVVIAEPGPTLLAYDLAGALVCQQWLGDPVAERVVFEVAPLGDDAFVLAGQIRVPGESPNLWIARFAGPNP